MLWLSAIIYCLVALCSDIYEIFGQPETAQQHLTSATDAEYLKILNKCSWFMQRVAMCSQADEQRYTGFTVHVMWDPVKCM